jgi:hypothetical protein
LKNKRELKRANKIAYKKQRALKRKQKRIDELSAIRSAMWARDYTFKQARSKVRGNGTFFECEMRYADCEERGHCNGDC